MSCKIILDAMGGDLAPKEALLGAALAQKELGVSFLLTGDETAIRDSAAQHGVRLEGMEIVHAPQVIPMDADPTQVLKLYSDSSLAVGLQLLAQGRGDAFVSAGSTGALLVGGTFLVKRIKGVRRPAIATQIPVGPGQFYLLVDAGANHDCRPEMLQQFALMGSAYMQSVCGIDAPRVGLINIGSEAHKGDDLRKETYALLQQEKTLNFIGNVEARQLPMGDCDVAVCDGFTGNIVLKLSEGFGKYFSNTLKEMLLSDLLHKVAALILKKDVLGLKQRMDYKEAGGAPLLGVRHPVIKAHGSSDARAFKNAIRQAQFCAQRDVAGRIEAAIAGHTEE